MKTRKKTELNITVTTLSSEDAESCCYVTGFAKHSVLAGTSRIFGLICVPYVTFLVPFLDS